MNSRWDHSICESCWTEKNPGRQPHRIAAMHGEKQQCCYCGREHESCIGVRENPTLAPCLGLAGLAHSEEGSATTQAGGRKRKIGSMTSRIHVGRDTEQDAWNQFVQNATGDLQLADAGLKEFLRLNLPRRDWYVWIRYSVFLGLWGNDYIGLAIPPAGPIIAAARARLDRIRKAIAPHRFGIGLTVYPDQYTRDRLLEEYGRLLPPTPAWPPRRNRTRKSLGVAA